MPIFSTRPVSKTPDGLPVLSAVQVTQRLAATATTTTLADLRASTVGYPTQTRFYVSDVGKEGMWYVDPLDLTTVDNTGLAIRTAAGQCVKRLLLEHLRYMASWWDIVGDGVSYWQNKLESVLQQVNNCTIVFGGGVFCFDALPAGTDLNKDVACGISLSDRQICFRGQGTKATVLLFEPSMVGISNICSRAKTICRMADLTIQAKGKNQYDGKIPDGNGGLKWSEDLGNDYKFNGINAWNQVQLENVDIDGFSGNNLCIFGSLEVKIPGRPVDFAATIQHDAGNGQMRIFVPDRAVFLQSLNATLTVEGHTVTVGGSDLNNQYLVTQDVPQLVAGTTYTFHGTFPGYGLVADCGHVSGIWEFRNAGGANIYMVASDANQWTFIAGTLRASGYWNYYDGSLLGGHCWGTHATGPGGNFNKYGIDGIPGNNYLPVGNYTVVTDTADASLIGCYAEGGTGGPDKFREKTYVGGGCHENGIEGGHGIFRQGLTNMRYISMIQEDGSHFTLKMQNGVLTAFPA